MTDTSARGDHFSGVAQSYAEFRPTYPAELFDWLASVAPSTRYAWDCGAGSGQATGGLAERFERVIATDVSAEQVARGQRRPNVEWIVAPAEKAPIPDACVDLVAVAQALHWFDFEAFYAECRRVAAPGALLVAWTYGSPTMDGAVGEFLREFMYGPNAIGPYWPPERNHVLEEYRTIPFPFPRAIAPRFKLAHEWTRAQVVGYTRSMSATARFVKAKGYDPVPQFEAALATLWPGDEPRRIAWPLIVLAGKIV